MTEAATGRPLARAAVRLETPAGVEMRSTLSDAKGLFVFGGLAAGAYQLSGQREGFLAGRYGEARPGAPGTAITLAAGTQFFADLKLRRPAAVSGTVLDENGVGLARVGVQALRLEPRPRPAGSAVADDRGVYRIGGLAPGRYLLRSAAAELPGGHGLLPTYYPAAVRLEEGVAVEARADAELTGVDIVPQPGRLGSIEGVVSGAPPGEVTVELQLAGGAQHKTPAADGKFQWTGVEPGRHELVAWRAGRQLLAAAASVTVAGGRSAVALALRPAPRLALECPPEGRVFLERVAGEAAGAAPARCGETVELLPGEYTVAVAPPADRYVAAVVGAVAEENGYRLRVRTGEAAQELRVELGRRPGVVRGTVRLADGGVAAGAPVYLRGVAAEVSARAGGVRAARCDGEGKFEIRGLPPGEFVVVAALDADEAGRAWRAGGGRQVTLEENGEISLSLVLEGGER